MDDLFRVRDHVPDFAAQVDGYKAASAATRAGLAGRLDIPYGAHPHERLDLFFPPGKGSPRPVHLFVHGGYWRAFSKNDYSFVADSVTACGAIAAIVDYSLMPGARMATLVDQVRRAAAWLFAHAAEFGGDPATLTASGHSAGAHLASYLGLRGAGEPASGSIPVKAILAVSGLYDLDPLSRSFLQDEIRLTPDEIAAWSPLHASLSADPRWEILVGEKETAPFHRQAEAMAAHLRALGAEPRLAAMREMDHMSIVRALGTPGTAAAARLAAAIAAGAG